MTGVTPWLPARPLTLDDMALRSDPQGERAYAPRGTVPGLDR